MLLAQGDDEFEVMAAVRTVHWRLPRQHLADGAASAADTAPQQLAVVRVAQVDGQVPVALLDHYLLRYGQGGAGQPVVQVGVPAVAVLDQRGQARGRSQRCGARTVER